MRQTNLVYLLAATLVLGLGACSGKNKAAVAEKAAQATNNPAQCPKLAEGYYNADNSTDTKFIEVYDNKDQKRLELNLNGYEQLPVNGKDTPQKNGFRLTAACTDNSIHIVGKDQNGNLSDTTIKPATDGGLQVEQNSPKVAPLHYSAAGGLRTPMDAVKNWFTTPKIQKNGTGLPQQGGAQPQPQGNQPKTK
jgi:hypothetical protein